MLKRIRIGTILNIILLVLMASYTYSWMVTEPSYGEVINYERDLIIASSGVDVEVYLYDNDINDYVLYEDEDIVINNMAPNDAIRFKFVMKNTKRVSTLTDIIFANIYGDIEFLTPFMTFECSSPDVFVRNFASDLKETSTYGGLEVSNYMKFYDDFKVESGGENIIYWSIKLDKTASHDIIDKTMTIDNIIFMNS